jgi:D-alanine transaminase
LSRIAYVNGRYLPHRDARVGIEDRGYQFADGVYEVMQVAAGALVDEALHFERLRRSLGELDIAAPAGPAALALVVREIVRRNRLRDGMVYIQVTRGVASRDHPFPVPAVQPSLVVTARSIDAAALETKAGYGVRVITVPDLRWKRPDIKSISLLPNVLAKQAAKARGAAEAWLVGEGGLITEGAASNAWIILPGGRVITHPVDQTILKGVTRTTLLKVIADAGLALEERPFSPAEAYAASEAFITGATTIVMPVISIDDRPIAQGVPGKIVLDLRRRFHAAAPRT